MKFEIHNSEYEDYFVVSGDTIEEARQKANDGMKARGWKEDDCYSQSLKED